jgi:hypothetical protein
MTARIPDLPDEAPAIDPAIEPGSRPVLLRPYREGDAAPLCAAARASRPRARPNA